MTGQTVPPPFPPVRRGPLWGALALLLLVSLVPRLLFALTNDFSYDETHNLMFATLAAEGFVPYREVFTGIAPFALLSIEGSAWLWGSTPLVRLLMLAYGILGVLALFGLVRRQATAQPLLAATLAALLFSVMPVYFAVSTTINLEAAALAFGLLSVWAMEEYRARTRAGWLVLSGALFALSLGIKVLVPFIPGVILVQMVQHWRASGGNLRVGRNGWALVRLGLVWSAGLVAVVAAFSLLYDPRLVYAQVVDFRLALRDVTGVNLTEDLRWPDLVPLLPLGVGAVWGALELRRGRNLALWVWLAWLGLSVLFLFSHTPLRPRHIVAVVPPLAALSGMAVAARLELTRTRPLRFGLAVVAGITLAGLFALATQAARIDDFVDNSPARAGVIRYIQATTAPSDCIVSKENRLHFLTGRLSTPYLSEVSTARLAAGLLTGPAIRADADRYDCAALVYSDSFDELAPALAAGARSLFALRLDVEDLQDDDPIQVYAVPVHTAKPPAVPGRVELGGEVIFHGHALTPSSWARRQPVYLSTYWSALVPPSADYKIFVHVIDGEGQLAQSLDHFPFTVEPDFQIAHAELNPQYLARSGSALPADYPATGLIPTRVWIPGQVLKETLAFTPNLPPGTYTVRIGLYDPVSGARLDIDDAEPGGVENHIDLATVEVR